jgi:hypothetical protein
MLPCTLIGSNKGGVGKSLLAQLVIAAYDTAHEMSSSLDISDTRTDYPLKVIEIDNQRRLNAVLGPRVDLSMGAAPSMEDIARDRNANMTHFDRVYDEIGASPSIIDLGANVTSAFFSWARHFNIKDYAAQDGIRFRFVAVATPDTQALSAAISALREARLALGDNTELFLALNDVTGGAGYRFFDHGPLWEGISKIAHQGKVSLINLPYCDSLLMEWARARDCTIKDLLNNGLDIAAHAAEEAGMAKLTGRIEAGKFAAWIATVQEQMAPLFRKPELRSAA